MTFETAVPWWAASRGPSDSKKTQKDIKTQEEATKTNEGALFDARKQHVVTLHAAPEW